MPISFVSDQTEALNELRGRGFRHLKVIFDIDRNNGTRRYFSVFSTGKQNKLFKLLCYKWLYDNLTLPEFELLFNFPQFQTNPIWYNAFKAKSLGVSKGLLREKIKFLLNFGQEKFVTYLAYKGLKNNLIAAFYREQDKLPRVKPYSGYTKHYKDKGSLGSGVHLDSVLTEWNDFDHSEFVLEFFLGMSDSLLEGIFHTDDDSKKGRNQGIIIN